MENNEKQNNEFVFADGERWVGKVIDGKLHGKGTLYMTDGETLEMEFNMGCSIQRIGRAFDQYEYEGEQHLGIKWRCDG